MQVTDGLYLFASLAAVVAATCWIIVAAALRDNGPGSVWSNRRALQFAAATTATAQLLFAACVIVPGALGPS
ncbi:MAG: hypothetical protein ABIT16_04190 [Croceibacterium sp.]